MTQPASPSPRQLPVRHAAVALVAAIPAAGAAYAAHRAIRTFDAMTRYQGDVGNGHGGLATIAGVFARANAALLAAVVLGLAITLYLRFARQRSPDPSTAIPATRLSLVTACLGGLPAVVVYVAESGVLAAFASPAAAASVMAASARMIALLWVAVGLGLAIALAGVVAAVVAWKSSRLIPSSAAPWAIAGAVLLFVAVGFALRSFDLQAAVGGGHP